MIMSEIERNFFRDREEVFVFHIVDGTTFKGKVHTITDGDNGKPAMLSIDTFEEGRLDVVTTAIRKIESDTPNDPNDTRSFLVDYEDSSDIWHFQFIGGAETVSAKVYRILKRHDGEPLTLKVKDLDDVIFEIPWTAIQKIW